MEIQFWVSYAAGLFVPDFDWKFSFGYRVRSGFLSLILIGNSVLGIAVQLGRRFPAPGLGRRCTAVMGNAYFW